VAHRQNSCFIYNSWPIRMSAEFVINILSNLLNAGILVVIPQLLVTFAAMPSAGFVRQDISRYTDIKERTQICKLPKPAWNLSRCYAQVITVLLMVLLI
jgi:hypothetical protein